MTRRALDAYYTPDALTSVLVGLLPELPPGEFALEPHCGGGAFVRAMEARCWDVLSLDVEPGNPLAMLEHDFLAPWPFKERPYVVVGNSPFTGAEEHVRQALSVSRRYVAFLLRLAFLESKGRIPFWREWPARKVWVLAQRPSFTGGKTDSCAYMFVLWDKEHAGPTDLEVLDWKGRHT